MRFAAIFQHGRVCTKRCFCVAGGPFSLIAAGHLRLKDDESRPIDVITTDDLPGAATSSGNTKGGGNSVKLVDLPDSPASERAFLGAKVAGDENTEETGVHVTFTPNYDLTIFAGSCVFVELHFQKRGENGKLEDVCCSLVSVAANSTQDNTSVHRFHRMCETLVVRNVLLHCDC